MFGFAQDSSFLVNGVGFLMFVWCVGILGCFFWHLVPFDYFADCKTTVKTFILTTKKQICSKIFMFVSYVCFILNIFHKNKCTPILSEM